MMISSRLFTAICPLGNIESVSMLLLVVREGRDDDTLISRIGNRRSILQVFLFYDISYMLQIKYPIHMNNTICAMCE